MDASLPSDPSILFEPLRLGLMSEVPSQAMTEPGCSGHVETTYQLSFPVARRLTLVGFSRAACPIDAAIGGGLTYVVPLRPSVFFVASGGILVQPPYGPRPLTIIPQARADVVFDRGQGRSWSVGVKTNRQSGPSLTFGGVF